MFFLKSCWWFEAFFPSIIFPFRRICLEINFPSFFNQIYPSAGFYQGCCTICSAGDTTTKAAGRGRGLAWQTESLHTNTPGKKSAMTRTAIKGTPWLLCFMKISGWAVERSPHPISFWESPGAFPQSSSSSRVRLVQKPPAGFQRRLCSWEHD